MADEYRPSLTFKIIVALIVGFVFFFWVVDPWLYLDN